jgi:cytochrome c oxidase subunit IV
MSIGASIFLIAVGAIVRYAFTFEIEGVDREALGLILMIAGAIGLALSILYMMMWSNRRRHDEAYYDPAAPPPPAPDDRTRRLR